MRSTLSRINMLRTSLISTMAHTVEVVAMITPF